MPPSTEERKTAASGETLPFTFFCNLLELSAYRRGIMSGSSMLDVGGSVPIDWQVTSLAKHRLESRGPHIKHAASAVGLSVKERVMAQSSTHVKLIGWMRLVGLLGLIAGIVLAVFRVYGPGFDKSDLAPVLTLIVGGIVIFIGGIYMPKLMDS